MQIALVTLTLGALTFATPHAPVRQSPADDAAVIDVALTAASLARLVELFKGAPTPPLLLRSQTAAVCEAPPKPGMVCIDAYVRTLREQLDLKPNVWPPAFADAVLVKNRTPRDLSRMTFASAKLTAPDTVSAYKTGQALAQVSQPAYIGDRAIVFVWTTYSWSIAHAVLMEKRGNIWEPIAVETLGRS